MSRSHNFEEERTLLRKVRQRCDGLVAVSPAKMVATSCVEFLEADPALVSHTAQLDVLADVYSCLLNTNLVLNVMTELCFIMGLLVVRIPVECNENADTNECMFFSTVHNCVYFAVKVLNQQRQLLESFDKVTLKMLADNRYILAFRPELYKFINELLIADACRRISVSLRSATVQANVSYQSDTDNRQNFPNDQAFHMFRKQRDGLYEILRMWEANHLSPGWSFAVVLGPRIRTLLSLHNEPANFIHFARLFRSQLLGTCSGYSRCTEFTLGNDSGGNSLDILKEVNPDKLSRLRERLVTPIPSGGPCPLPTFPGQQEFYRNFILHSSHPMFLQHLTDSLISEILDLNDTDFTASDLEDTDTSVDDATRSSYLACVSALRLLAKFLGFIVFLPYQSKINPLPESMVTAHSTVRAKLCPQFDVLACVNEAVRMHKLVLTLPWIVKYLSMMDSVSVHLPYYWAVFEQLFCIYQSAKGPGRSSLLVRLLLGWLFESPNFPESLFYAWKQTNNLVETGGELGRVVPLDSLDVVDEHCLYLCCPFLGELKLCLSVGIGSSSRSVKHITPVSASLNQPSAARQIELLLEESFFHGQPASTRKTVEYIAERVASCCVKHICNTLLPRVKQQGSANVEKLLSARINTDTPFSETAVKQLKESLLKEVTVIADKCSDDFRQCFYNDVTEYCQQRCKRAMPPLLADDVLETVCHTCAQIAARLSQERVNMWIQSHITAGLFLKEFQLDIEKAFRNASKGDNKNDSICKASHVVPPGGRNVKHIDAVVTPAQAIMQVRELIWQLLDGHKNNVSEQQVLALLKMVHSTLSNRADLIPSAEKMLPTLLVDLALSLVVHQPAMMTSTLMDGFMHVLRLSEECESVMRLLCPRNLLLMSQSAHTADVVWSCFAKLLAHLLKSNMLTPDGLEQQCVALLQVTWPQGILNRISSCIREVIQLSGSVGDEKFMFLMQWLMETCDEMTLFNDI
ncbi:codanin-1 isoform X3 [Periplaneta americana]